ncbi:spore coat protein U domain-containing protein [Xanthomonas axonopodis pv. ricini]|uniref:spore coat protein U domain-containing protein n=1 Tax=Xanthomonas euvesicatoria TaxID=456327 RepID=UPI0024566260|nr:spore coat protein U domain-containing protein [Xanthomonas euvesicatoria]MDH4910058.1 spore coat protein U domain-containing protein [Xanthomonas euvesicatoria]
MQLFFLPKSVHPAALAFLLLAGAVVSCDAEADDLTDTLTVSATITASCSITLNSNAIDLGTISAATIFDATTGSPIKGLNNSFTIGTACAGTDKATLSIVTSSNVTDGYIVPGAKDVIRFGISDSNAAQLKFDAATKRVDTDITTSDTGSTTFNVYAVAGADAKNQNSQGTYSSTLTFGLTPD